MPILDCPRPVMPLTRGPAAHFFGYYDKPPWDASGRRFLVLEAPAVARMPLPDERVGVCVGETASGRLERMAETGAWNWQQGCMLQWLPPGDRIVHNDVRQGQAVAVVLSLSSGCERVLPRPVYHVAHDGRFAPRWTSAGGRGCGRWWDTSTPARRVPASPRRKTTASG